MSKLSNYVHPTTTNLPAVRETASDQSGPRRGGGTEEGRSVKVEHSSSTLEGRDLGREVVHHETVIAAVRHQALAVGAHAAQPHLVPAKAVQALVLRHVPDPDCAVVRPRDEEARRPCRQRNHSPSMAWEKLRHDRPLNKERCGRGRALGGVRGHVLGCVPGHVLGCVWGRAASLGSRG
eukprot:scaffold8641_cov134-Isochrysis_galbana.AAC.12